MNHTKVNIDGFGTYEVPREDVRDLIAWLSQRRAIYLQKNNTVKEVKNNEYTGRQLLEEDKNAF